MFVEIGMYPEVYTQKRKHWIVTWLNISYMAVKKISMIDL